jgi:NarL family two-component system response regulator LiaR
MSDARNIRVMIVDDHAVVRSGLSFFLMAYPDLELVGEASNGREAIDLCGRHKPDVVLMDIMMPEMDGITATQLLRKQYSHVQVIALTSFMEEDLVQRALHAGVIGYLLKNTSAETLANAIRSAYVKRPTLAPEATEALIRATTNPFSLGRDLTEREREVLALLIEGLNNPQIADRLSVSRSTVKFHISNILGKLGAATRLEAISLALQHRLVS